LSTFQLDFSIEYVSIGCFGYLIELTLEKTDSVF